MRIAIHGFHSDTLDHEPYDETWGLAHDPLAFTFDRVFESHSEPICRKFPSHIERLKEIADQLPLYTPWGWERLGRFHVVLPHRQFSSVTEHFESSIAYPMALAIRERPEEIGLYGINMAADEEYSYQRPNMHYLIGFARAKGIRVAIHPNSRLFESQWTGGLYGHPDAANDIDYRLATR